MSTGPILAAGGIVLFNEVIVQGHDPGPKTTRTAVATLIAAAGLTLAEKALPGVAVALAWLALIGVIFVRVDQATPAPVEAFATWLQKG